MTNLPIRVSIFGSCVSRDTIEACEPGSIKLQRYIARQSLISSFSAKPQIHIDISELESPFQRRMVQGDIGSSFATELSRIAIDSDFLLWDLIDERYGVYSLPNGAFVTRSLELISAGADSWLQTRARFIPFGSDEHFSRWSDAFELFARELVTTGLVPRTRLLVMPWANKDTSGRKLRTHTGVKPSRAERAFEKYYATAARFVSLIRPHVKMRPVSPSNHRWGPAPYHYRDFWYRIAAKSALSPEVTNFKE